MRFAPFLSCLLCLLCLQYIFCGHKAIAYSIPEKESPLFAVGVEKAQPFPQTNALLYSINLHPCKEVPVLFAVDGYIEDICTMPQSLPSSADPHSDFPHNTHTQPPLYTLDAEQGSAVQRGAMLVQLRTTEYQSRVAAAQAALNKASASRHQMELDVERGRTLLANKAIKQAQLDNIIERTDAMRSREEAARISLARARESLKSTTLFAPIDGIISQKNAQRGMFASAGSTAYIIADISRMKARFTVPDWLAEQLELGAELPVNIPQRYHILPAQIIAMTPSAAYGAKPALDAEIDVEIEVELDNSQRLMKDNMVATIEFSDTYQKKSITKASHNKAGAPPVYPALPMSSFISPEEGQSTGYTVFIIEKNCGKYIAIRRAVELGRVEGDRVEILSGVNINDTVVTIGAGRLHDSALVHILPNATE